MLKAGRYFSSHNSISLLLYSIIFLEFIPIYFAETEIFYPQQGYRIDGLIILNKVFLRHMESRFNILIKKIPELRNFLSNLYIKLKSKDYLLIDFSLGLFKKDKKHKKLVARKTLKYRNLPNSLLLLVGTRWDSNKLYLELTPRIRYKAKQVKLEDTRLISPFLFEKIVGIPKNYLDTFSDIIQLSAEKDIYGLEQLLKIYEQKNIKKYGTDDFARLSKQKILDFFSF